MNRRTILAGLAAFAAATPLALHAQPPAKVYRVAFVASTSPLSQLTGPNPANPAARAFVHHLRDLGYAEGRNLVLDMRTLEGKFERIEEVAADIVRLKPDVIFFPADSITQRAVKVTGSVPIVTLAATDFSAALPRIERERPDAVFVPTGPDNYAHREAIGQFVAANRLPCVAHFAEIAEHGCLLSYGVDINDLMRRSAGYAARILQGAKPGDLPIEQPTTFELVVNLKTAKALGLKIPQTILLRATRLIE